MSNILIHPELICRLDKLFDLQRTTGLRAVIDKRAARLVSVAEVEQLRLERLTRARAAKGLQA